MKIFFLIRGRRHYWPKHVKTLVHLFIDFFIFVLNLYSHVSKLSRFITTGIGTLELKNFGRTKDYEAHKMKIK